MKFEPADLEQIAELVTARVVAALADRLALGEAPASPKLLWTEREAADALGISPYTLRHYRLGGYVEATTTRRPISYDLAAIGKVKEFLRNR